MTTVAHKKELVPHNATHPGVLIADELEAREDLNQKELAKLLDVKPSFLNEIIKGKRPITAENALLLEKALGIPADFWMNMQAKYDLDLIRIKERTQEKIKNIEVWEVIKTLVPVTIFKKLGYIDSSLSTDIAMIFEIYNVKLVDELMDVLVKKKMQLYRKSDKLTVDEKNLFAWSAIAEYECKKLNVKEFDFNKTDELCVELNKVFLENKNTIEKVKSILGNYGIKFLILEKFNKTPVDGYCFWSDENPAIVMTKRHNRIDNFAFTLLHEIGHIALHLQNDKETLFIDIEKVAENTRENEANQFSRDKLIPKEVWTKIKNHKFPMSDIVVKSLSKEYGINPRIIIGRMCYENNNWNIFSQIPKEIS